jgi:hypothetical protein
MSNVTKTPVAGPVVEASLLHLQMAVFERSHTDETPDSEFPALVDKVARCTEAKGADQLVNSVHDAAWQFCDTYNTFSRPYGSPLNAISPTVMHEVEKVVGFLTDALRSWCPLGALTQVQLGRLNSSLLLMRSATGAVGLEAAQAAVDDEIEDLENSVEVSFALMQRGGLAALTLEQLNHHKALMIRSGNRLSIANLQTAIDLQTRFGR